MRRLFLVSLVGSLVVSAKSADKNKSSKGGSSVLGKAAQCYETPAWERILNKRLDAGKTHLPRSRKFGNTPIHVAVKNSCSKNLAQTLELYSVDVNAKNEKGETALHLAAKQGNAEFVYQLFKAGATLSIPDNQDPREFISSLWQESKNKKIEKQLKRFLKFQEAKVLNEKYYESYPENRLGGGVNPNEPIFADVYVKLALELNMPGLLLSHRYLINSDIDPSGAKPLYFAILEYPSSVKTLLNMGADPNVAVQKGLTPLHYAAKMHDSSVVEALLWAGANPQSIMDEGEFKKLTPILLLLVEYFNNEDNAAKQKKIVEVAKIIVAKLKPEHTFDKASLLNYARNNRLDALSFLIEVGFDINESIDVDNDDIKYEITLPDMIKMLKFEGKKEVIKFLKDRGAEESSSVFPLHFRTDIELIATRQINEAIQNNTDTNKTDVELLDHQGALVLSDSEEEKKYRSI